MNKPFWLAPILPALLVSACVAPIPVVPTEARLSTTKLVVTMSDGAICTATLPSGAQPPMDAAHPQAKAEPAPNLTPTGWAGTFQNCGHPMKYEVSLDARRNLVQGLFYGVFGLIGLDGALAPNGQVRVENGAGEARVFTSPPPVNWH